MIEVLQAAEAGKEIQSQEIYPETYGWDDMEEGQGFNFCAYEYQVKPKIPWIPYDGKLFPDCNPDDLIDVTSREGELKRLSIADAYNWRHMEDKYDIVFWRLSK